MRCSLLWREFAAFATATGDLDGLRALHRRDADALLVAEPVDGSQGAWSPAGTGGVAVSFTDRIPLSIPVRRRAHTIENR